MACPHVSGVAALIASQYRNLTPEAIKIILSESVNEIDDQNPSYIGLLGTGRLNAFNALITNDSIPPAPISDLMVTEVGPGTIDLNWTASGGSDTLGQAARYDLRISTS